MLKSEEILNGLQTIVNENSTFAVFWHVLFYVQKLAVHVDIFLILGTITLLVKYILSFKTA
jgi:hypothetical protein